MIRYVLRLVPTPVTLSDLEGVIALILLYFTEFDSFAGALRHSGWRSILSAEYRLPLLVKTDLPCNSISLR